MISAVFMSIKEIHINRILSKIKNHEFRTKKPKKDFDYIIVYVPTQMCIRDRYKPYLQVNL